MKVIDGILLVKISGTGDAPVMVMFNVTAKVGEKGTPDRLIAASMVRIGNIDAASDTLAADAAEEAISVIEDVADDDDKALIWTVSDLPAIFRDHIQVPINSVVDWDVAWTEEIREA